MSISVIFKLTDKNNNHKYTELLNKLYSSSVEGLKNRRYYDEKLKTKDVRAFVMIDIDNLKSINDCCGHLVGDEAIEAIGKIIVKNIKNLGIAVRYGGDEYCICIFEKISAFKFKNILNNILEDVRCTKLNNHQKRRLTLSIGGVYKQAKAGELIEEADKLLYIAKRQKNKIVLKIYKS